MEKDIAEYIKKEFDKNHGPTWHCIVGRNFGNPLSSPIPFRNSVVRRMRLWWMYFGVIWLA